MMSDNDQQSLIDKLQVFKIHGRDKRGNQILRVIGKFFPARFVSVDAINQYLREKIFPELEKRPFSVLYIQTGVERLTNFPGISALRSIYDSAPIVVKKNLESVYFVHPDIHTRLFLATFGRFFFTGGFYGKVKYVNRIANLWEHVRKNEVEDLEFVYEHDEELEERSMIDYGIESDHPRVYGAPSLDSPVATYSTRCI